MPPVKSLSAKGFTLQNEGSKIKAAWAFYAPRRPALKVILPCGNLHFRQLYNSFKSLIQTIKLCIKYK